MSSFPGEGSIPMTTVFYKTIFLHLPRLLAATNSRNGVNGSASIGRRTSLIEFHCIKVPQTSNDDCPPTQSPNNLMVERRSSLADGLIARRAYKNVVPQIMPDKTRPNSGSIDLSVSLCTSSVPPPIRGILIAEVVRVCAAQLDARRAATINGHWGKEWR